MNRFVLKRTFYKQAFNFAKKVTPKMSDTEKAALESGTIGIDRDIYNGRVDLGKLHKYDVQLKPKIDTFISEKVNPFCEMLNDERVMKERDMNKSEWKYLKENKFFGMLIPEEYGGLGISAHGRSQIVQRIATRSGSAATTVMVPNSLGPGELLLKYGTEEQKKAYLPKLANGEYIPCFGLTGVKSGSDAAGSMEDSGVVKEKNGKLGVEFSVNKRYITLAPVSNLIGLAIKLKDPEGLLKEGKEGITLLLVERKLKGLEIGRRHDPLGAAFMNGPIRGKNLWVPVDQIIGGEKMAGFGWNMLMECLAEGRGVSLPAAAIAVSQLSCATVGSYAVAREQFKTPLAKMEGVQEKMAEIVGLSYQMRCTQYLMNGMLEQHEKPSVLSAVMKEKMTEKGREIVNHGMDIVGGIGICKGDQNFLANPYIQMPVSITVEGSNTLTRSLIIFGQGFVRSHPYIFNILDAIGKGDNGYKQFRNNLTKFIGHGIRNFFRGLKPSFGGKTILNRYYQKQLEILNGNFAFSADLAAVLGGKLKFAEMTSGRYADIFSNLYIGYSLLHDYNFRICSTNFDNNQDREDLDAVFDYAFAKILYEIQESFYELGRNYPNQFLGKVILNHAFTMGRRYNLPDDKLKKKVAGLITYQGLVRNILTDNVFVSSDKNDTVHRLDKLMRLNRSCEEFKKLQDEIIEVNDFPFKI